MPVNFEINVHANVVVIAASKAVDPTVQSCKSSSPKL
jgi:hypothetical protein